MQPNEAFKRDLDQLSNLRGDALSIPPAGARIVEEIVEQLKYISDRCALTLDEAVELHRTHTLEDGSSGLVQLRHQHTDTGERQLLLRCIEGCSLATSEILILAEEQRLQYIAANSQDDKYKTIANSLLPQTHKTDLEGNQFAVVYNGPWVERRLELLRDEDGDNCYFVVSGKPNLNLTYDLNENRVRLRKGPAPGPWHTPSPAEAAYLHRHARRLLEEGAWMVENS